MFVQVQVLQQKVPGPRSQPVSNGALTRRRPEWGHSPLPSSPLQGRFLLFPDWCLCCSVFKTHTEKVLNTEQSVQKVEQRSQKRIKSSCACLHAWEMTTVLSDSVAHQASLSMEFPRQEFWCGLPCPPPELQSMRSQRVGHDLATEHTHIVWKLSCEHFFFF